MLLVFIAFLALVLAVLVEEDLDDRISALETRVHALEHRHERGRWVVVAAGQAHAAGELCDRRAVFVFDDRGGLEVVAEEQFVFIAGSVAASWTGSQAGGIHTAMGARSRRRCVALPGARRTSLSAEATQRSTRTAPYPTRLTQ